MITRAPVLCMPSPRLSAHPSWNSRQSFRLPTAATAATHTATGEAPAA